MRLLGKKGKDFLSLATTQDVGKAPPAPAIMALSYCGFCLALQDFARLSSSLLDEMCLPASRLERGYFHIS